MQTLAVPPGATNAFGINDNGNIVGQYPAGANMPGFYLPSASSTSFATILQPVGANSTVVEPRGSTTTG